jgi:hypothetical protein
MLQYFVCVLYWMTAEMIFFREIFVCDSNVYISLKKVQLVAYVMYKLRNLSSSFPVNIRVSTCLTNTHFA